MKQFTLLLILFLSVSSSVHAQNEALNRFIEQHRNDKGFTFAYLSKELFEVVSKSDVKTQDWHKLHQVVQNIGALRILASDKIDNGLTLYREATATILADEMDELLTVRDDKSNVRIWTKDDGSSITDLILLVGTPSEFVLICFTGQLELDNIAALPAMFNAAEATQLATATEAASIQFGINPNPSRGTFTLTYSDPEDAPESLSIADQNGRVVSTRSLSAESSQQIQVDVPAGLYWVQVRTLNGRVGVKQIQIVK